MIGAHFRRVKLVVMKKLFFKGFFVLSLFVGSLPTSTLWANNNKPPRPEKIEESPTDRPSEYHIWMSGHWKWKRKTESWEWMPGYWKFDQDLYFLKNRWRLNNYYRPWRYLAIPIGRGYYRIVRY